MSARSQKSQTAKFKPFVPPVFGQPFFGVTGDSGTGDIGEQRTTSDDIGWLRPTFVPVTNHVVAHSGIGLGIKIGTNGE